MVTPGSLCALTRVLALRGGRERESLAFATPGSGMSGEAKAIEALVESYLDAERHGVYLQGGLIEPLLAHLVGTLGVKKVPRDLPESYEEWLKCAEEAFLADSKELPGAFEVRLRRWVKGDGLELKDVPGRAVSV